MMQDELAKSETLRKSTDVELNHIAKTAEFLRQLSFSFFDTGNDKVGKDLEELSRELHKSVSIITGNRSEELNNRFKSANEMSGNILKAALAGVKVANSDRAN